MSEIYVREVLKSVDYISEKHLVEVDFSCPEDKLISFFIGDGFEVELSIRWHDDVKGDF